MECVGAAAGTLASNGVSHQLRDHYSRMALSLELERAATALVSSLLLAVDQRDYEYARQCLADTVHFDTTSLGGPARDFSADEMIAGLQSTFRYLSGTQHL